ncbi:MAG: tetratricopeptide repeat protein [Planctomycetota bacterium]|nr:tetratricopeptide repeat protein [Planctomycetota bacterium]MDA1177272.1 tetratricopeptide repeat protein [Planctomycetota bacterium]
MREDPTASPSSPDRHPKLVAAFQRGKQLSSRDKNYDYAHEMFALCAIQDPGNLAYVEAMFQNLRTKFQRDKKQRPKASLGNASGVKKAISHANWTEAFTLCVEQLQANPWHVPTLRAIAEACATLHLNEVELAYLKQALDADPKSVDVNRHCARSLARMGQFDQAMACWHRIEQLVPRDREAPQMIGRLSQEKIEFAMGHHGPANDPQLATTQAATKTAKAEPATMEPAPVTPPSTIPIPSQLTPRQLLEQAIAMEPTHVSHYLELARLLAEQRRCKEARHVLEKCIAKCGDSPGVQHQLDLLRTQELDAMATRQFTADAKRRNPVGIPWLEIALVVSGIALVVQLVPGLNAPITRLLSEHGRTFAFVGQFLLLAALLAYKLRHVDVVR